MLEWAVGHEDWAAFEADMAVQHGTYGEGLLTYANLAARHNHVSLLEWLHEHDLTDVAGLSICLAAVAGAAPEALAWAHEHSCAWNATTMEAAAAAHDADKAMQMVQYLHGHGCGWDEQTLVAAIHANHVELLQWAHERGAPWGVGTLRHVRRSSECYKWAIEHGCPLPDSERDESPLPTHHYHPSAAINGGIGMPALGPLAHGHTPQAMQPFTMHFGTPLPPHLANVNVGLPPHWVNYPHHGDPYGDPHYPYDEGEDDEYPPGYPHGQEY